MIENDDATCLICGQTETLHNGMHKFCPTYPAFRAASRAVSTDAGPAPTYATFPGDVPMENPNAAMTTFPNACLDVRRRIKEHAACVKLLSQSVKKREALPGEDHGEMIANLMLCYRHLEDASMRLGKAIQASDGGVSVYDRETTVGA